MMFEAFAVKIGQYFLMADAAARRGELPLWDASQFLGQPLLGNPEAGLFYPGSFLFYLLSLKTAWIIFVLLHLALLGAGVYSLGVQKENGPRSALLGSALLLIVYSAYFRFENISCLAGAAWLPWILAERIKPKVRWMLLVLVLLSGSTAAFAAGVLLFASGGIRKKENYTKFIFFLAALPAAALYLRWFSQTSSMQPALDFYIFSISLKSLLGTVALLAMLIAAASKKKKFVYASTVLLVLVFLFTFANSDASGFTQIRVTPATGMQEATTQRSRALGWSLYINPETEKYSVGTQIDNRLNYAWGFSERTLDASAVLLQFTKNKPYPPAEGLLSLLGVGHYADYVDGKTQLVRHRRPVLAGHSLTMQPYTGRFEDWASKSAGFLTRPLLLSVSDLKVETPTEYFKWSILELETWSPEERRIAIPLVDQESWIFISESRHQGWQAKVDNQLGEIVPAEFAFQAIKVPPQSKELRFRFREPLLNWLIATALLLLGIGFFLEYKPFFRRLH